jgi:hypothetical protein
MSIQCIEREEAKEMRISEREIQESLRLLSEQPIGSISKPPVDEDMNRLVLGRLSSLPDMRMERVLPLRQAIRERRYNVPEIQVARMLLGRCLADNIR